MMAGYGALSTWWLTIRGLLLRSRVDKELASLKSFGRKCCKKQRRSASTECGSCPTHPTASGRNPENKLSERSKVERAPRNEKIPGEIGPCRNGGPRSGSE